MTDPTPADARFARCLAFVCGPSIEGGFVNDPQDPGGATNHGITLGTLSDWRGHACSVQDVRDLALDEATQIYRSRYWHAVSADNLPGGVDLITFDAAVNQGAGTGARLLQGAVGVTQDGAIGPATLAAVGRADASGLIDKIAAERMARYRELPGWGHDGHGWSNRVQACVVQAHAWVNA